MARLLSAPAGDITSWRAAADFVARYRQALLAYAASDQCADAEMLLEAARSAVEAAAAENQAVLSRLNGLLEEVALTADPPRLKQLTSDFYGELYHQLDLFHSAPAFYQGSMTFLRQISAALVRSAARQLESEAGHVPPVVLVALGPAGRCEYSPFCPLQLALLHGDVSAAERAVLARFGELFHAGFEGLGLRIDAGVTPRNPEWRGTLTEWQQRCSIELDQPDDEVLIDQLRLAEQYQLYPPDGPVQELKAACIPLLRANRPALSNLIGRMASLSNGLGLMGGLKLERRGPGRGLFHLLAHGLLPLSAAISALALINGSPADSTPDRIRDLLSRHLLDVEMAERMLTTWHTLHELRLFREGSYSGGSYTGQPLYLNPDELQPPQRLALKEALESVAVIQHQVVSAFSGIEA